MRWSSSCAESFEVVGSWWLPDTRDRRMSGRLSYRPDHGLRLRCGSGLLIGGSLDESVTLHGVVDGEYWTLAECRTWSAGSQGHELEPRYAVAGVGLEPGELKGFDEITVEFDGGWHMLDVPPRGLHTWRNTSLDVAGVVGDDVRVSVRSELESLDPAELGGFGLVDRLFFTGTTASPVSFFELFDRVVAPLHDLVRLGLQRDVAIRSCTIAGPATMYERRSGRRMVERCSVYWHPTSAPCRLDGTVGPAAVVVPTDPSRFELFMAAWFRVHHDFDLPLQLRLADVIADLVFAQPKFLLAAQALEALHRRLHPGQPHEAGAAARAAALAAATGEHRQVLEQLLAHAHEPTFRQRIRQLLNNVQPHVSEVAGDSLKDAVGLSVDTRNAVTHWAANVDEPDELTLVALRLLADAVFDLNLIQQLGTDNDLETVADAHLAKHVDYWLHQALLRPGVERPSGPSRHP